MYICICMYIDIDISRHIYMYIDIDISIHIYMYTCIHTYAYRW